MSHAINTKRIEKEFEYWVTFVIIYYKLFWLEEVPDSDVEKREDVDDGSHDDRSERKYILEKLEYPSILFLLQLRDNKTIVKLTVKFSVENGTFLFVSAPSTFELQRNIRLSTRESDGKTQYRESRLVINISHSYTRSLTHFSLFSVFKYFFFLFFFFNVRCTTFIVERHRCERLRGIVVLETLFEKSSVYTIVIVTIRMTYKSKNTSNDTTTVFLFCHFSLFL